MDQNQVVISKYTRTDYLQTRNLLSQLLTHNDEFEIRNAIMYELRCGHNYYLAFLDSKLVGLVTSRIESRPRHGLAELVHIVVSEEAHGMGIGRKLIAYLEQELQSNFKILGSSLRRLFLLTRETNNSAQAFYKKQGFMPEQLLLNHFYEGKNEQVMAKYYDVKN